MKWRAVFRLRLPGVEVRISFEFESDTEDTATATAANLVLALQQNETWWEGVERVALRKIQKTAWDFAPPETFVRDFDHGTKAVYAQADGRLMGDGTDDELMLDGRRQCGICEIRKPEEAYLDIRDLGICSECWRDHDEWFPGETRRV